jgi:hypothetical protein
MTVPAEPIAVRRSKVRHRPLRQLQQPHRPATGAECRGPKKRLVPLGISVALLKPSRAECVCVWGAAGVCVKRSVQEDEHRIEGKLKASNNAKGKGGNIQFFTRGKKKTAACIFRGRHHRCSK